MTLISTVAAVSILVKSFKRMNFVQFIRFGLLQGSVGKYVLIRESPAQYENRMKPRVYVRRSTCILARPDDTSSRSLAFRPLHYG